MTKRGFQGSGLVFRTRISFRLKSESLFGRFGFLRTHFPGFGSFSKELGLVFLKNWLVFSKELVSVFLRTWFGFQD